MSGVDSDEEAVLRKHASEFHMAGESWIGYINGDNLQDMLRDLTAIGVSFKTASSRRLDPKTNRFVFSYLNGNVPLHLNAPFRLLSKMHKGCYYGKDRHKTGEKNAALLREGKVQCKSDGKFLGRKRGTRKIGCKATMQIKVIEVFPEFKIEPPEGASQTKIKDLKSSRISMLSEALTSGLEVHSQIVTFFIMTRKSFHTEHGAPPLSKFGSTMDAMESNNVPAEPSTVSDQIESGEPWTETDKIESGEPWIITEEVESIELPEIKINRLSGLQRCALKNADKAKAMAVCCANEEKLRLANSYLIKVQKLLMEGMPDGTIVQAFSAKTCSRKRKSTQVSTLSGAPTKKRTFSVSMENAMLLDGIAHDVLST